MAELTFNVLSHQCLIGIKLNLIANSAAQDTCSHVCPVTAKDSPLTRIKFEFPKELICQAVAGGVKLRDQICVGSPRPDTERVSIEIFNYVYQA